MIKIENTDVYGWEAAIRGARNPMNSWDKSDSCFKCNNIECEDCYNYEKRVLTDYGYKCDEVACNVGSNDLKLLKNLSKAGNDHGKFLRMITVTVDLTAPLYWWKEFDTYKVGTVANSCSTMHKIHSKEFTLDDFSYEHLEMLGFGEPCSYMDGNWFLRDVIEHLNRARNEYLETKDKKYWWQMIQLLPSSYNQKRTVQLNYQVLKSMYFARRNHKLDEWHILCSWMEELPYFKEVCIDV